MISLCSHCYFFTVFSATAKPSFANCYFDYNEHESLRRMPYFVHFTCIIKLIDLLISKYATCY